MIPNKPIRTLILDGSLNAEVVERLRYRFVPDGDKWLKWDGERYKVLRPSVVDAVLQMAVKVALVEIAKELHTRPGLDWEEKAIIDGATTNRERILAIQKTLPELLKVGE